LHEKFAILIELNNSAVAVTIRNKEVSVRHDSNSSRFAEMVIIIARNEGNSKSEKCFPTSLRELEYLMQSNICHPYIVVYIHSKSMWKVEPAQILPN
jgi:ribosomal protein L14